MRTNANEEVRNLVPEINSLAERIGALNVQIGRLEVGDHSANDLRDDRDLLLDQLARLINITTRERQDGQVDVFVGSDQLVNGDRIRAVEARQNTALDPERGDLVEIRFADTGNLVQIRDGEIFGALTIRDAVLTEVDNRVDTLAATLIEQLNRIQSQGNGLVNLSGTITGTNAVDSATNPLISAGLPFNVTPGTFDVIVYDSAGNSTTTTITVTATTTLNDLAAALSAVPNFTASVSGNTLTLGAAAGSTFGFANDTSGTLTALGTNGLFTGTDARSIAVNPALLDNPALLASATSTDILDTGDNTAALAMANLRTATVLDSGAATLGNFYESMIVRLGVDARANAENFQVAQAFISDFQRRREETSGVSIDEEVTNLLLFQRAFEASARIITIADRMLEALLQIAR